MNTALEAAPDLRTALMELASEGEQRRTPTGRRSYCTRKVRHARQGQVRIANRFVPRHSLAITVENDLSPSARLCLPFLLSLPRDGLLIRHQSHGAIARHFAVTSRTAQNWLNALQEVGYLLKVPVRRGVFNILLAPKAVRFCRIGKADLAHLEFEKKRRESKACERPEKIHSPSKAEHIQEKEAPLPKAPAPSSFALPPLDEISTRARIMARLATERTQAAERREAKHRSALLRPRWSNGY